MPPDLSVIVKARGYDRGFPWFILDLFTAYQEQGADYLVALLTGYADPPKGTEAPPGTFYNKYFPGHFLAMPPPLTDGRIEYTDGTKPTADQLARDVTAFLAWAAEPHMEARKRIGLQVIIFLIVFAGSPLFHQEEGVEVGRGALIAPGLVPADGATEVVPCVDRLHCCCSAAVRSATRARRAAARSSASRSSKPASTARKPRRIEQAPGTATRQRNILSDTGSWHRRRASRRRSACISACATGSSARPNLATVKLVSVTQYPAPGLKNPKSDSNQTRGEHSLFATIGQINYRGYVFEHDWEMVPGAWTLELWDGKRKLASQTFDVVKP